MHAGIRAVGSMLMATGLLLAAVANAQLATHRIAATFQPLEEEYSNGAAGPPDGIAFGTGVAIRNATALIGMPQQRDGGRVAVFVRSASGWNRTATLRAAGASGLGRAIAFRDNTAIVGSQTAAYVYKLVNGTWRQTDRLVPPAADNVSLFAVSVAYQDGYAVVGAQRNNAAGAVYVYRLSSSGKRLGMQRLQASDGHAGNGFGADVSMTHDTIVVGAPAQHHPATATSAGAAYVFRRTAATWYQRQILTSTELDPGDRFGEAVGINNGLILIGAPRVDARDGRDSPPFDGVVVGGAVYGYVLSGSSFVEALKLRPDSTYFWDFGREIAMFADRIAVGAQEPHQFAAIHSSSFAYTYTRMGTNVLPLGFAQTGFVRNSLALANNWLLSGSPIDDSRCGPNGCVGYAVLNDLNYLE